MARWRKQQVKILTMDRRHFLQKATLLATGSALGLPLAGCAAEFELIIPCLGPAAAPTPVPGMTYIRASEIGCALDCNLENGHKTITGGPATDDGPRINAAMAGATAENPITLIIDGSALISGLFLPAGGYWSIAGLGCGTGFFVKTGTNNDGIHNGGLSAAVPSDPGPPAPPRGASVSLSNFTLNGNQGNGSNGDSTSKMRQGQNNRLWYFGINLINLNDITIENVVVVNTPTYHIRLSNVGKVAISGCVMQSQGTNTDGLHFDGPANDITISDCTFMTGDDSIALNSPEGYSGNIMRVSVDDCTFNSVSLMRLYTASPTQQCSINSVTINNCKGTLSEAALIVGNEINSDGPSPITDLNIANCTLTAPTMFEVGQNFGDITASNTTFIPVKSDRPCGFIRPSPTYLGAIYGSSLSFNNCTISRSADIDAVAVILHNASELGSIIFDGFAVQDAGSYSRIAALLQPDSGSIRQLIISSLNSSNIAAPVTTKLFTGIGSISGAGVLATEWELPDFVMANEVPYISASSGLPSIKVEGVVEPYIQS
jgi:hypothetical protein